jgi:hypothetical protein
MLSTKSVSKKNAAVNKFFCRTLSRQPLNDFSGRFRLDGKGSELYGLPKAVERFAGSPVGNEF